MGGVGYSDMKGDKEKRRLSSEPLTEDEVVVKAKKAVGEAKDRLVDEMIREISMAPRSKVGLGVKRLKKLREAVDKAIKDEQLSNQLLNQTKKKASCYILRCICQEFTIECCNPHQGPQSRVIHRETSRRRLKCCDDEMPGLCPTNQLLELGS